MPLHIVKEEMSFYFKTIMVSKELNIRNWGKRVPKLQEELAQWHFVSRSHLHTVMELCGCMMQ